MPRTSWEQMASYKIAVPPDNEFEIFEKIVSAWFDQIISHVLEIRRLVEIRDYLLPKLLSGEIEFHPQEN